MNDLAMKLSELYANLGRIVDNETNAIRFSCGEDRVFHKGRRDGAEEALMHFYRLELEKHLPPWD